MATEKTVDVAADAIVDKAIALTAGCLSRREIDEAREQLQDLVDRLIDECRAYYRADAEILIEDRAEAIRKAQSSASSYEAGNLLDARLAEDEARHLLRLEPRESNPSNSNHGCAYRPCATWELGTAGDWPIRDRCKHCGWTRYEHI
jgi:hypothetical protein